MSWEVLHELSWDRQLEISHRRKGEGSTAVKACPGARICSPQAVGTPGVKLERGWKGRQEMDQEGSCD